MDFLKCLIVQLHAIFDFLVDFFFGLYYDQDVKKVPPIRNNLLLMSASELAEKIRYFFLSYYHFRYSNQTHQNIYINFRTKQVSCEEVVKIFIDRAKEVNKIINAVVEDRYHDALEEAKEVDKLLQTQENIDDIKVKKPFLGIPFTTKESIEAKGNVTLL